MNPVPAMLRLIVALCFFWSTPLFCAVGKLDSFEGDVRIASRSGERAAQAGLVLEEGDTIHAGAGAWALLAMTDGATVTVRPNTQMRIDAYRHVSDGAVKRNRSVITLVQGALRVITGLIGQFNRTGYSIVTPTGTIGIRGTDHEPAYYPPGDADRAGHPPGTYDKVNSGETFIRNARGVVYVRAGQAAFAHDSARLAPQTLARPPEFYQQHAAIDQRAAPRRTEIQRRFERERQQRQTRPDATKDTKGEPIRQQQQDTSQPNESRSSERGSQGARDERPGESGERTQRDRDERGRDVERRSTDGSSRSDVRRDDSRHGTR